MVSKSMTFTYCPCRDIYAFLCRESLAKDKKYGFNILFCEDIEKYRSVLNAWTVIECKNYTPKIPFGLLKIWLHLFSVVSGNPSASSIERCFNDLGPFRLKFFEYNSFVRGMNPTSGERFFYGVRFHSNLPSA